MIVMHRPEWVLRQPYERPTGARPRLRMDAHGPRFRRNGWRRPVSMIARAWVQADDLSGPPMDSTAGEQRPGRRILYVASPGGHLLELLRLSARMRHPGDHELWVTFRDAQSEELPAGRPTLYEPRIEPRDVGNALRSLRIAHRLLATRRFDVAVSTGSGVALPFLPPAARAGVQTHYVESAARAYSPSLTGRLLATVPQIHLHAQYGGWGDARWHFLGSVFDGFVARPSGLTAIRRAVVTLGTMRNYGFDRAVTRLQRVLPPNVEVLWQVGATHRRNLPTGPAYLPPRDLESAMRSADVVVAHAGVGTAITALSAGKCPVLLPRRKRHGEHVDDHQVDIARALGSRGLAVVADADEVSMDDLALAASWGAHDVGMPALSPDPAAQA